MTDATKRIVLVLFLVAGAAAAWVALATFARGETEVTWSGAPECTGTRLRGTAEASAEITMLPGMRCEVPVEVRNTGWLPVTVDSLTVPLVGPHGGSAVMLEDAEGDVDAIIDMGRDLDRGETVEVVLTLVFRDDGCSSEGSITAVGGFPTATVSAFGWGTSLASPEAVAFVGSAASSCDS